MKRTQFDALTVLSGVTALGLVLAAAGRLLPPPHAEAVMSAGALLVYVCGGAPAAWTALTSLIRERTLDIDLLMVVAAVAAAVVGAPFEGAVLLTLFSLSTTLERRALGRARRAVEALMALRPETALVLQRDGSVKEVAASALVPGDRVVLRPGARVPGDGEVAAGHGGVDEANITGESMPVSKEPGAPVFEGTINLDGVLEVVITRPVSDSTIARMIALVTEAQEARAPSERFSTWFGQRYTIGVLCGAALAFAGFYWLGQDWELALYRAATLLVAASPCAIVISVPAAILSALSAAARGGVLFKGGGAIEALGAVSVFAFDKTGTLTTGRATVTAVVALDGDERNLLRLLAGLEAHSEHHIAAAIARKAREEQLDIPRIADVTTFPSAGVTGHDGQGVLWAGNPRMAAQMGANIDLPELKPLADGGQTVIYFGRDGAALGAVTVADTLRPTSAPALRALRAGGVKRIMMLTGDRRPVALRIGGELGLAPEDIEAGMLPQDKVATVARLTREGKVAFVGDGVNDAAALARADVGVAMGAAGSDVALQAADVALLSGNMMKLAEAHRLARRATRIIRQNLVFAIGAMLTLVVGGLLFDLPLPLAVVGHEGGTVLVVLNGLRLLSDPIRRPA
ncbi:heavy metal translocating P-type ATPase [Camelimonas abortus]|uniref:Heavy metal translocating P-type ATPase n=1 Tax=Camelimonas abortus TaxID=1017184 RepID=A0ABV7LAY4_9HYPH